MNEPRPGTRAPDLSVVVPCFNEEEALPLLLVELLRVLDAEDDSFEIVLVDDGSSDGTFAIMESWCAERPECRALQLSRNFGHQAALTAGLDAARGAAVITLDGDLQHPPALIPTLVERWKAGYEVVLTERRDRGHTPFLKRATSAGFYRLLSRLSSIEIRPGASDYRLLDRRVVAAFADSREIHRMLRGLVAWVGFRRTTVPFEVGDRAAGRSKYNPGRMLALAMDGIFSFSIVPLRLAIIAGALTILFAAAYLVYVILTELFRPEVTVPGWASILGVVLLVSGVQIIFLGILGEYVGRIYQQAKERPIYLVRRAVPGGDSRVTPPAPGRFREPGRRASSREADLS